MTHVEIDMLHERLLGQLRVLAKDTSISRSAELHPTLVGHPFYPGQRESSSQLVDRHVKCEHTGSIIDVFWT